MQPLEGATTVERKLMEHAAKNKIPINGSIELLPLCNMKCDMCYVRLSKKEMEAKGRIHSAKEWLEIGKQMKDAGVLFLLLTGGEPLLHPEFKEIYLGLKKMGMILTINTNGTLIDEEWVAFFKENLPRRINITLYGTNNETYQRLCHYPNGFDKVIKAIQLLKANHIDVRIGGSITKLNVKDLDDLLVLQKQLDIPVRCDTYMMPATRERDMPYNMQVRLDPLQAAKARVQVLKIEMGEQLFQEYIDKSIFEVEHILPSEGKHHMHCHAGSCSFTINWQGEMRPCVIMTEPAMSVFDHSFWQAWQYIHQETRKIILCQECNSCNKRTLCRTCAACALLETGSYEGKPEYMCQYAEETYRLLLEEKQHETDFSDR